MRALTRGWWILALRGVAGVVFGFAAMLAPLTFGEFVLLFGGYVFADGLGSIAAALRSARRLADTWPLLLEGAISAGLGIVAWFAPAVPRGLIYFIGFWGIATGILELVIAATLPKRTSKRWLITIAGLSSVLVGMLVMALPSADAPAVKTWIAIYALVFGGALLGASWHMRRRGTSGVTLPACSGNG
ncbi:MAG: DUF308 domain-containing protein [Candidatus Rokubacteria bacterium]|nr:DUF308 domain-containing protein [Candidatus Rokubacteria bacterium]